jgi:hypothetical protein
MKNYYGGRKPVKTNRETEVRMNAKLNGKRVAILVAKGFEQVELTDPREALDNAGAQTEIISPAGETVRGWVETELGRRISRGRPFE